MRSARRAGPGLAAVAACVAIASVLGGGCRARARRTPDDTLVVLIDSRLGSPDPRFTESNNDIKVSHLVAPGLTTIENPGLEPRLFLAEAIDHVDDLTVDVTLKPGLLFSDGTPLTSADVVYTYMSTLDPATKSGSLNGFRQRFRSVEALGPRRVRFHLVAPVATLMSDMEFGIVSSRVARAHGGRFPGGRVVGAGPYRVASFSETEVELERNPRWAFAPPPTPKVRVRVVDDTNARALMLVGGSADLVQNAVRIDLADDLAARKRVHMQSGPSAILTYIMMNNRDPVLKDVRVRRAIAYALDRTRVIRTKLGGHAVLATGLLPPGHWAYEGDVDRYPYDPDKARALLDQAGYPVPPGGGPRLRLTYKTSSDAFRRALASIWAAQLGRVGIQVEVQAFEFGTFFQDIKKGNYQLAAMQTAAITEPDWLYAYFHSSRIPTPDNPNANNRWRYHDDEVDRLTELGRRTIDPAARRGIYSQVQKILAHDVPIIPLWHEDNLALMNRSMKGYRVYPSASLWGLVGASKAR